MADGPVAVAAFLAEVLPVAGKIKIPSWLKDFLDEAGAQQVQKSVEHAEMTTQAEIVPMIVRSSATKGFLPFQIFLILALFSVTFFRELPYFGIYWLLILSLPLSVLLANWAFIQRWLIPKADQIQDVYHRAHFEFFENKLGNTSKGIGVLVFVSLNEHRCVVLADQSISEKVDSKVWDEAIQALLKGIKSKNAAQGFCDAIDLCAKILGNQFPATHRNPNELANHLIVEE